MMPIFLRRQGEPRWLFAAKVTGIGLLGFIGVGLLAILFGFVVMWLWNWLMPALFGFKLITFWQGVAIVVLARIIFGGCSHRPGWSHHSRHRCKPGREKWTDKWAYYEDYWKEEGEKAFETYVQKRKNPGSADPNV